MAAILFQRPVMIAIHASEMLKKPVPDLDNLDTGSSELITLFDYIGKYR